MARMADLGLWHSMSILEVLHLAGGLSFLDVRAADIPPNIPSGKDLGGGGRNEIRLSMNFPAGKGKAITLALLSCAPAYQGAGLALSNADESTAWCLSLGGFQSG